MSNVELRPALVNAFGSHRRFVGWRYETVKGRKTKPPYQIRHPDRLASVTDPGTWASYQDVRKVRRGTFKGYGMVLTDLPYIAVLDLDNVRDPKTGKLTAEAQAIVKAANTYTEVTPSGCGLRVIGSTSRPKVIHTTVRLRTGHVEIYRGGARRFITITNDEIGDCRKLRNIDQLIDDLIERKAKQQQQATRSTSCGHVKPAKPAAHYLRQAEIVLQSKSLPPTHSNTVWLILMLLIDSGMSSAKAIRAKVLRSKMWPHITGYDEARLDRDINRALQKKGIAA